MGILIRQHAGGQYDWIEWQPGVELISKAASASVVYLLSGLEVTMLKTDVPKVSAAELQKLVPFAIENQLSVEIDQLYFCLGRRNVAGQVAVAVIDKQVWRQLLDQLKQQGISPESIVPDYLALPWQPESWTILIKQNVVLVRTAEQHGFAVDRVNLKALLQLYLSHNSQMTTITVYDVVGDFDQQALKDLAVSVNYYLCSIEDVIDLQTLMKDPPLNLLQREFRPKQQQSCKQAQRWRYCAVLAGVWLLLLFVGHGVEYVYFKHQQAQLQQQINQLYQQLFPGAQPSDDPRSQVTQLLSRFVRQAAGNEFLTALQQVAVIAAQQPAIKISRLDYQNKQLSIQVSAPALVDLERYTQALVKQGLTVKQSNLVVQTKHVSAELLIGGVK